MKYRLEEIADIYDSLHQTPSYIKKGIPMVRVTDLSEGYLDLSKTLKVSEEVYNEFTKKHIPRKNDIIMSRVGTYGVCTLVNTDEKFCLGQNTVIISPQKNKKFLYYYLNSRNVREQIEGFVTGSTQKTISLKNIKSIIVELPNEEQQEKISNILYDIDKKIKLNNKINDNLHNILNSLFKCWFEDYNLYKQNELVVTEIGNIPKDFELIELDELISIRGGVSYKASKLSENSQDNILISMGNVELNKLFNFNNLKYYSEDVANKYIADAGDLFICTRDVTQQRNQLGCPGVIPKIFKDRNVIIGTNLYIVDYKKYGKRLNNFLFLLLNSSKYRERIVGSAKGTAILMIAKDDILKFKFAFPKDEQILNRFNKIINPLFDKIENNICENNVLEQLRDTLLPKLMNGEIDLDKIEI